ncbi:cytochrome P450 [Halococcus sp. IIIV-5B]|uniref:cytochrome P450 n=1 Tax=Halococcus sp. IIIV-5B TaxID=2321230 RepID=UPI000E73361D|nr:cytochrome P450 [Halococcus sp. IIIV-5B]RJT01470.1 cytochrome P450 [Halococcus sp. IIIV-5B]
MQSTDSVDSARQHPAALQSRDAHLAPFEWYAEMRSETPVHYDEQRKTWDVFRYEDVDHVLRNYEQFSADRSDSDGDPSDDAGSDMSVLKTMISTDPPEHERLRGFVNERFQPGTLREYRPRLEELTDELIDGVEDTDRFDFVEEFAVPFPVTVIAELLGIPAERRDQFREWSSAIIARPDDPSEDAVQRMRRQRETAQKEMGQYFGKLLQERQSGEGDDLITLAATADELNMQEKIGFCMILLLAGNITTTNLLTNAIWSFEEQGITEAVRSGDIDRKRAIEEVLRYRSPIQEIQRVTTEPVELGGHEIETGEIVNVWVGAANRDPEVFDDPDAFRPERSPNQHLAFGKGIHYCLGAPLARLEADIALDRLLARFDRLDADLSELHPISSHYGLRSLPCRAE